MQLHQRLKTSEESTSGARNKAMMKELENAVMMTQSMLTKITTNRYIFICFYYSRMEKYHI